MLCSLCHFCRIYVLGGRVLRFGRTGRHTCEGGRLSLESHGEAARYESWDTCGEAHEISHMAAPGNVPCTTYTTVHCATAAQTAGHTSTLVHCACVYRKAEHRLSAHCFVGATGLRNWESLKEYSGDSYLVPLVCPSMNLWPLLISWDHPGLPPVSQICGFSHLHIIDKFPPLPAPSIARPY